MGSLVSGSWTGMSDKTCPDRKGYALYIGFFFLYAVFLIFLQDFDMDMFHILQTGREVATGQDIYHNLRCSYDGLKVIHQQWLYSVVIYWFYTAFGQVGMRVFILLQFALFWFLFDRLCAVRGMSTAAEGKALFTVMTLQAVLFSTRPWMFTLICLLAHALCMESALRYGRYGYLWSVPVIMLVSMSGRMALWPYHLAIYFAYFVAPFLAKHVAFLENSFRWQWKKVLLPVLCSFFVLFLNPYTYRGVLYVFYSLAGELKSFMIAEMQPALVMCFTGVALLVLLFFMFFHLGKGSRIEAAHFLMLLCGAAATFLVQRHFVFVAFAASLVLCSPDMWDKDTFFGLRLDMLLDKREHVFLYPFFPIFASAFLAAALSFAMCLGDTTMANTLRSARSVRSYLEENGYDGGVLTGMVSGAALEYEGVKCSMDSSPEEYTEAICGEKGLAAGMSVVLNDLLYNGGLSDESEAFAKEHNLSYACFFEKDRGMYGSIARSGSWEEVSVFGDLVLYREV